MLKTCNKCGLSLPLDDFYVVYYKARKKYYRRGHCKACDNARHREDYQKHRDKRLEAKRESFKRDPWVSRLNALRRRCATGFLTVEDLKKLVANAQGRCEYCGQPFHEAWTFDHAKPISRGGTNDPENMRVCCLSCNSAKGAMDEEQFRLSLYGAPF